MKMYRRRAQNPVEQLQPANFRSPEHLKYLHELLNSNQTITNANHATVIEILRLIAEIVVWGDQNNPDVFFYFMESGLYQDLADIIKRDVPVEIHVQILQTLNIIFENVRNEHALYYLLSNNTANNVISFNFKFENDDIIAYFSSLLKTLSLKLNSKTVHFFFNEQQSEFPLLTVALRHFNNSEPMVRTAIRTVTLNVFRIDDDSVRHFCHKVLEDFLPGLMETIVDKTLKMDTFVRSAQSEQSNKDRLATMIDEQISYFSYFNDILANGPPLQQLVAQKLWTMVIDPLFLPITSIPEGGSIVLGHATQYFLLTNVLLFIDTDEVQNEVIRVLLFGDEKDVHNGYWFTNNGEFTLNRRPAVSDAGGFFFNDLTQTIGSQQDQNASFFALLFVLVMNRRISPLNSAVQQKLTAKERDTYYQFQEGILLFFETFLESYAARKEASPLRPVWTNLLAVVIRQVILGLSADTDIEKNVIGVVHATMKRFIASLEGSLSDDEFLDLFEEEYYRAEQINFHVDNAAVDAELLLPPVCIDNNESKLLRDLPSARLDFTRVKLLNYFILRKLYLDLTGEHESQLPLTSNVPIGVEVNDCIDLSNSDILMCSLESKGRFDMALVTDQYYFILAERHKNKFGYGVVTHVGYLENLTLLPAGRLCIEVVIKDPRNRFAYNNKPVVKQMLFFPDNIRAFSAKQRLMVSRKKARQSKMSIINDLFEIRKLPPPSPGSSVTTTPVFGGFPGSLVKHYSDTPSDTPPPPLSAPAATTASPNPLRDQAKPSSEANGYVSSGNNDSTTSGHKIHMV